MGTGLANGTENKNNRTMTTEELRIGNIVFDSAPLEVRTISGSRLMVKYFEKERGKDGFFLKSWEIEPIPISKEWLLNFGFNEERDQWFSKDYFIDELKEVMIMQVNISSGRFSICDKTEDDVFPAYTKKRVKHVHQLQNLYFALTGEELTLKP